ncbi:MAG: hypothetical protein AAGJ87_08845 [Pseudomonadota bacterium]
MLLKRILGAAAGRRSGSDAAAAAAASSLSDPRSNANADRHVAV